MFTSHTCSTLLSLQSCHAIQLTETDTSSMASRNPWFHCISSLSDDPTHPGQITLRTYALSLALSLGSSLIPFITDAFYRRKSPRTDLSALKHVLRRELGYDGFAFAITLSVGGGAVLHHLWNNQDTQDPTSSDLLGFSVLDSRLEKGSRRTGIRSMLAQTWKSMICTMKDRSGGIELTLEQRTFLAYAIASSVGVFLLQKGRNRASGLKQGRSSSISPTMDLTLLLAVRALDSVFQSFIQRRAKSKKCLTIKPIVAKDLLKQEYQKTSSEKLSMKIDALLFWACSARFVKFNF